MVTFDEILEHFGGTHQTLADALGCSREAVTMWKGQIPETRAYQIAVLSHGKFSVDRMPVRWSNREAAQARDALLTGPNS